MQTLRTVLKASKALPEIKPKQVTPQFKLNQKQNYLYLKAILGVKGIPKDLIEHLSEEQKYEIDKEARKVQKFLNIWKQELCIDYTNKLFLKYFPNTMFTKDLITKFNKPDPKSFNTLNWKELGVSKAIIAKKLIENGFLPENFYQL